eukprot:1460591-Amphidinium_carterae.1
MPTTMMMDHYYYHDYSAEYLQVYIVATTLVVGIGVALLHASLALTARTLLHVDKRAQSREKAQRTVKFIFALACCGLNARSSAC